MQLAVLGRVSSPSSRPTWQRTVFSGVVSVPYSCRHPPSRHSARHHNQGIRQSYTCLLAPRRSTYFFAGIRTSAASIKQSVGTIETRGNILPGLQGTSRENPDRDTTQSQDAFVSESPRPAIKLASCFTRWPDGLVPRRPTSRVRLEKLETAKPWKRPLTRGGRSCALTARSLSESACVTIIDPLQTVDLRTLSAQH
jgi:hypothetical protein